MRAALNTVFASLEGEVAEQLFPDLETTVRALAETLVQLESERAAAEAEAQVLAEIQLATERVTEEQVRMLEFSDNTDQDTLQLLDSLVTEIDTLAQTRRAAREETNYAPSVGRDRPRGRAPAGRWWFSAPPPWIRPAPRVCSSAESCRRETGSPSPMWKSSPVAARTRSYVSYLRLPQRLSLR